MIIPCDYNNIKYNIKYLFIKALPEIFYPLLLHYFYKKTFGCKLNLKNPKKLSEKILYINLYDKNPMKTFLLDKLNAKMYVVKLIPNLKTAKVYQICNCFQNLDFNKAPNSFVIKTNHAWKSHILVENKNELNKKDYEYFRKYYNKVLSINFGYWDTPELLYKNIKPKIYLEEYLYSNNETYIKEYEVYCFNGKPEFINYIEKVNGSNELKYTNNNNSKNIVESQCFNSKWEKTDFNIRFKNDIQPKNIINKNLVLEYAEILANGFNFVRIDFLDVNDQLYFCEYTFTPYAGFIEFNPSY